MSSTQLFLDQVYTLDGVTVTGEEIRDAIIDSALLKGKLSQLLGDAEWLQQEWQWKSTTKPMSTPNAHTTTNVMVVGLTAEMMTND